MRGNDDFQPHLSFKMTRLSTCLRLHDTPYDVFEMHFSESEY